MRTIHVITPVVLISNCTKCSSYAKNIFMPLLFISALQCNRYAAEIFSSLAVQLLSAYGI